mmetsp:Transcript_6581/g.29736  ORF Transcript_6581/g.29736 Transcript_6581/m.29736 type:complete len:355 (-) Transcript_6581:831-1895(-)
MRTMSWCIRSIAFASWPHSSFCRCRFWSSRLRRAESSVFSCFSRWVFSVSSLFSLTAVTSSVCQFTQRRWSSLFSFSFCSTSLFMFFIVASIGPRFSPSSSPPDSASSFLFSRSTSLARFAMSSLRRLISASYLSTVRLFSASSESKTTRVSSSVASEACVFKTSTRVLAISFCNVVTYISWSRIFPRISRVASMVRCTPFSTVVCSERLDSIRSSCSRDSAVVFAISFSVLFVSSSSALASLCAFSRCDSVSSSEAVRRACVSMSRSFFSRQTSTFFERNSPSASILRSRCVSCSFVPSASLICRLYADVSASIIVVSSACVRSAFCVACSASSRRAMPTSEVFHCDASCFFS